MKKNILLLFLLAISANNVFAKNRKLPKQLLPTDSVRRHSKLKKIFGSPEWKKVSDNSISSGILTIKNNKCFVNWQGKGFRGAARMPV